MVTTKTTEHLNIVQKQDKKKPYKTTNILLVN